MFLAAAVVEGVAAAAVAYLVASAVQHSRMLQHCAHTDELTTAAMVTMPPLPHNRV